MFPSITLFGKTIELYGTVNVIAYLAGVLLLIIHLKEYRGFCTYPVIISRLYLKKRKSGTLSEKVLSFCEAALLFILAVAVVTPLNRPLSLLFLGDTSDGYFPIIFFVPLVLFVFGVVFRASPLRLLDYAAPVECLMLIIAKIACYCDGCCYGVELASSPFYNRKNERYELPIQLIEIAFAVAMFAILLVMRKKRKRAGFLFPAFIVMYCGSRFISEFWRDDYPGVVGAMNGNHLMCLIGFVLGVVYLVLVFVRGDRITAFFDGKNKAYLDRKLRKAPKKIQHKKGR